MSGEVWALCAGFLWAVAVILFKKAGEGVPPLPLNLFKNVVVLAALVPLCLLEGAAPPPWSPGEWGRLALSGLIGITLSDTLFLIALNRLGAGLNAVVDCFYSPWMVLLAFLFLGERIPLPAWIGMGLVVAAVAIAVDARPIPGRTRRDVVEGTFLGLLGMAAIAASVVMVKPFLARGEVLRVAGFRLLAGTIFLLPLLLHGRGRAAVRRVFTPSPVWRTAVPAALLGTGLAMIAWLAGLTIEKVSINAILNQLSTIFIFVLAALLLREPVTRKRVVAVVLAFAGAVLVMLR